MSKTILLADDSPTIRRIVELTFTDTDVRVESVGSGALALERMTSLRPDLVVADVAMPEPSGYEICRAIKESTSPVPVVLLVGTFEPFDPRRAEACGADAHLVKPFESAALRDKVESLLGLGRGEDVRQIEAALDEIERETRSYEEPREPAAATESSGGERAPETTRGDAAPGLSDREIDAVARVVVTRLSDRVVREIAEQVVPEIAARILRERLPETEHED
jgi:CheY-like chemotaxis protein